MTTVEPGLTDVPETMLWTLHNRASEALRDDSIIDDPKAVEIFQSIDYDYRASFGRPHPAHPIRSMVFDQAIRAFLKHDPDGTIVNLGEGLETQRFRIQEEQALWLSVDLPEAIRVRETFIQPDDRHQHLPLSAHDHSWFDTVSQDKPVIITAQGLLMYFKEAEVKSLLQAIGKRFPGATVMFDTIPEWFSRKTLSPKGYQMTKSYVTPRMPWGINRPDIASRLGEWLGQGTKIIEPGYASFPRGINRWAFNIITAIPWLKNRMPTIVRVRFPATPDAG